MIQKKTKLKIEESKFHFLNKHSYFLRRNLASKMVALLLVLSPQFLSAQIKIDPKDEQNIKRKSLLLVNKLAEKYNQLLQSDSFERSILIDNMTLPSEKGLMSDFVSDQVIIEDDFETDTLKKKSIVDKKVDTYFKDIGLYYGMRDNGDNLNANKKVVFSNVITSNIMYAKKNEGPYLQVFFEVKYEGIDSRTQIKYIQPSQRIAEVQIQKQKGVWQVGIKSMRYYQEKPMLVSKQDIIMKTLESLVSPRSTLSTKKDSSSTTSTSKKQLPKKQIITSTNNNYSVKSTQVSKQVKVMKTEDSLANQKSVFLIKKDSNSLANTTKKDIQKKQNKAFSLNGNIPIIAVSGTGLLSSILAINLNNKWKKNYSSIDSFNYLAIKDAESFKNQKLGLRNTYVGIAATSFAVDIYLIFRKTQTRSSRFHVEPSHSSLGLNFNYNF